MLTYLYSFTFHMLTQRSVYIRWNGMVEWNSGMDYWNGGMLHRTYLIIQHVLYSEHYPIKGNIRVCCGCQQKYSKPALPPHNLCVRHKEWQSFGPMDNQQTRFGNVYFHCNLPYVEAVWPSFSPEMLHIPPSVVVQLLPAHTELIRRQMPGRL